MRVLGIIWRLIAIPLTLGLTAFLIIALMNPEMQSFVLPLYIGCYVLSLSTVIRWAHSIAKYSHPFLKFLAYLLAVVIGVALVPITVIVSVFGRFYRIFINTPDYVDITEDDPESRRRKVDEEIRAQMRETIWNVSSRRAIEQILDESYKGDIKIDNGEVIKVMKQVALIKLSGKKYVLLSPKREDESEQDENKAVAYAIAPVPPTGSMALVEITDPKLYRRIFAVYESLVAERRVYGK